MNRIGATTLALILSGIVGCAGAQSNADVISPEVRKAIPAAAHLGLQVTPQNLGVLPGRIAQGAGNHPSPRHQG